MIIDNDVFINDCVCVCVCVCLCKDREASAPEGLAYRQQESHLCQQMKLATVSQSHNTQEWSSHEAATCSTHTDTGNLCVCVGWGL